MADVERLAAAPRKAREEFRVLWKRAGLSVKRKTFATRRAAERLVVLLGPEPWIALGKDPDEHVCCSGYECGCGGDTYRDKDTAYRAEAPPIEWSRVESRPVGEWTPASPASHAPRVPPKDPNAVAEDR